MATITVPPPTSNLEEEVEVERCIFVHTGGELTHNKSLIELRAAFDDNRFLYVDTDDDDSDKDDGGSEGGDFHDKNHGGEGTVLKMGFVDPQEQNKGVFVIHQKPCQLHGHTVPLFITLTSVRYTKTVCVVDKPHPHIAFTNGSVEPTCAHEPATFQQVWTDHDGIFYLESVALPGWYLTYPDLDPHQRPPSALVTLTRKGSLFFVQSGGGRSSAGHERRSDEQPAWTLSELSESVSVRELSSRSTAARSKKSFLPWKKGKGRQKRRCSIS